MDSFFISLRASETPLKGYHQKLMNGRWGDIDWAAFRAEDFSEEAVELTAQDWGRTLVSEYRSAAALAQFQSLLLLANQPMDAVSCASRFVQDEIRHAQLAGDVLAALGYRADVDIDDGGLFLSIAPDRPFASQLFAWTLGALCVGETVSERVIRASFESTGQPQIKEVWRRIHSDEAFHAEFGWNLATILLPQVDDETLAGIDEALPAKLSQMEGACFGHSDPADDAPLSDEAIYLGNLPPAGHRAAFYEAADKKLLPKLEALGFSTRRKWRPWRAEDA
jgi:hypothetical protein